MMEPLKAMFITIVLCLAASALIYLTVFGIVPGTFSNDQNKSEPEIGLQWCLKINGSEYYQVIYEGRVMTVKQALDGRDIFYYCCRKLKENITVTGTSVNITTDQQCGYSNTPIWGVIND